MRFRHLTLNDFAYGYELREAVSLLEKRFNYSKFELKELINMLEVYKFLCDYESLNDKGKELLDPYLGEKNNIKSTIGSYFNRITSVELLQDFETIKRDKELHSFEYFAAFIKYKAFKKISGEEFIQCVKNNYFHLDMILRSKDLVDFFSNEIRSLLSENPEAIEFLISCYDLADDNNCSKIKYYFPTGLKDIVSILIDNYLNYQYKHLNYLEALDAHKDNIQTYIISRKQRINIKKNYRRRKEKNFFIWYNFKFWI